MEMENIESPRDAESHVIQIIQLFHARWYDKKNV